MADSRDRTFVDRAAAALDRPASRDVVPPGRFAPPPAPGFRFAIGARVLDLVDRTPARVRIAYPGAASGVRIYELSTDAGALIVRVESQLEPWSGA